MPTGVERLAPQRLRRELARASLAVVGGGTTLYETCALGTPAVAVAVVRGQRATVAAFAGAGLVVAPGGTAGSRVGSARMGSVKWGVTVAAAAWTLWGDRRARRALSAAARAAIDGRGAGRVAGAIAKVLASRAVEQKERRR